MGYITMTIITTFILYTLKVKAEIMQYSLGMGHI
jgi:hypothetical protein